MKSDNNEEYNLVVKLLGRQPRTPFTVKTYCPDGTPQTIIANPVFLEDGIWKPFPAFLWLVCPRLKAQAGIIEHQGYVKVFTNRLKEDSRFYEEFAKGQKEIAKIRLKLAEELYPEKELPEHIKTILSENTIAGSKDIFGVKCLHSHLAHFLAFGNNPIGEEVYKMIGACRKEDACGSILKEKEEEK